MAHIKIGIGHNGAYFLLKMVGFSVGIEIEISLTKQEKLNLNH